MTAEKPPDPRCLHAAAAVVLGHAGEFEQEVDHLFLEDRRAHGGERRSAYAT